MFSSRGTSPPDPLTRGSAPGPQWGKPPDTNYRLALTALAIPSKPGFGPQIFPVTSPMASLAIIVSSTSARLHLIR